MEAGRVLITGGYFIAQSGPLRVKDRQPIPSASINSNDHQTQRLTSIPHNHEPCALTVSNHQASPRPHIFIPIPAIGLLEISFTLFFYSFLYLSYI